MITGLAEDLQKRKEKNNVRAFFSQSGLYPIPPPPNRSKISCIRAWIYVSVAVEKRDHSLQPSIVLSRSNDMFTFACL